MSGTQLHYELYRDNFSRRVQHDKDCARSYRYHVKGVAPLHNVESLHSWVTLTGPPCFVKKIHAQPTKH
jgi:hypothetical protein